MYKVGSDLTKASPQLAELTKTENFDESTLTPVEIKPKFLKSSLLAHLLVILIYTLLVLLFTWPLPLHLTEQSLNGYIAGVPTVHPDRDQNIWGLWWMKQALTSFHSPFHTDYLYYPYGVNLYILTMPIINSVLALPFYDWLGGVGALNLVCLISFVWCGYSAFLLADYLLRDKKSAFVAGFFFTLAPQHLGNLRYNQLNVISLEFFPLYLLYFLKLDHLSREQTGWRARFSSGRWWRYTVLAALFLILTTLSDQYVLVYSLVISGLYYLWIGVPLAARRKWLTLFSRLGSSLPALVLAGLVMLPYLYAILEEVNSGKWANVANESITNDLPGLFLPPAYNIFIGSEAGRLGELLPLQGDPRTYSLGLVGLALAIYGIIRCKEARWWGLILGVATVLALGPELRLGMHLTGIPLPAKWLDELPLFQMTRYSGRWLGPASLMIAIAAAYGLRYHLARIAKFHSGKVPWKQFGLVAAVLLIFTLEVEPWPLVLNGEAGAMPRAYAAQVLPPSDHRAILELPIVQKNGSKASEMYWQTAHQRPILGGYLSRAYAFDYATTPFSYFLFEEKLNQPDFVKVGGTELKRLLADYDFGYIAIYKTKLEPAEVEHWRDFVLELLGPATAPFYEDEQMILFRLDDSPAPQARC